MNSGGIIAILKALDTFATDSTIQEAGCIALHNLCAKSGMSLYLYHEDIIFFIYLFGKKRTSLYYEYFWVVPAKIAKESYSKIIRFVIFDRNPIQSRRSFKNTLYFDYKI